MPGKWEAAIDQGSFAEFLTMKTLKCKENNQLIEISGDISIYRPSRYNWPIFGFCRYIGIGENGRFYWPQ